MKSNFSMYLFYMSKVNLIGIAQDLFLLNDLSYKYHVGKVNESLGVYFYRTSLEGEKINLFLLEASDVNIVIPASNEWDNLEIEGLYKIQCVDCKDKFIFKEYNNIQTIKSASTLSVLPISDKEWEIEYTILDDKIRRFNIINQLYQQDSDDWANEALNIIFNDEAEIIAEKVPTGRILLENAKSNLSYLDKLGNDSIATGYVNIQNNNITIDLEDKGANYYVIDLKKLNKCFLYQQYIMLFYIKTYYVFSTYTDIRLVSHNGNRYMVFINQNDDIIIDMTFVDVIDVLVREKNASASSDTDAGDNDSITGTNGTTAVDSDAVCES